MDTKHEFPNWEELYQDKEVESMPWFSPDLDPDLEKALNELNLSTGNALDIGTGPGTQAIALAKKSFQVTATDLSAAAIEKAAAKAKDLNITWKQDDILSSSIQGEFNFVLDRGCFHVLPPEKRQYYVSFVNSLIKPKGYFFLKCFSDLQPGDTGPYRFTPEKIREVFSNEFHIISIEQTVYHGLMEPSPRSLFCIMQKS